MTNDQTIRIKIAQHIARYGDPAEAAAAKKRLDGYRGKRRIADGDRRHYLLPVLGVRL